MDPRLVTHSTVIVTPPEKVYALVADITRMGEWSPICKECWWDDDTVTGLGAWFTGKNVIPERTWETHCEVVAAHPGREFAFQVSVNHVRWGYTFAPEGTSTRVTESWDLGQESLDFYQGRLGDGAAEFLDRMEQTAREGMAATLAAIKASAEAA